MYPRSLTLSSVGQITLPRSVREMLGLKPGTKLDIEVHPETKQITLKKMQTIDEVMAELDCIHAKYPAHKIDPKYKNMTVGEMSLELAKDSKGDTWV